MSEKTKFSVEDDERKCLEETLQLLHQTKSKFHDIWEKMGGFDLAYFDVVIDLRIKVDDTELRVKEKWNKIQE